MREALFLYTIPQGFPGAFSVYGGDSMAGKGNPRRWRSAIALQAAVDTYFEECTEKGRVPSVAGLALALGFMSRQALYRYTDRENENNSDDYVTIITRAKLKIEEENIQLSYNRDASAGARFILQNGFNYSDKKEISTNSVIKVELEDDG